MKRVSKVCQWCEIVMDEDGNALRPQTPDERERFTLLSYAAEGLSEAYVCKDCTATGRPQSRLCCFGRPS